MQWDKKKKMKIILQGKNAKRNEQKQQATEQTTTKEMR